MPSSSFIDSFQCRGSVNAWQNIRFRNKWKCTNSINEFCTRPTVANMSGNGCFALKFMFIQQHEIRERIVDTLQKKCKQNNYIRFFWSTEDEIKLHPNDPDTKKWLFFFPFYLYKGKKVKNGHSLNFDK